MRPPSTAFAILAASFAMLAVAAAPASGAIAFRSAASAENVSGSTSLTINKPAGATTGDVILAAVDSAGPVPTPPSGWSAVGTPSALPWGGSAGAWYRVVAAGEPSSYTWGLGASSVKAAGGISAYSGVSNSYPIGDNQVGFAANSSTAVAPSVSPVAKNSVIVGGVGYAASGAVTVTADPSTTARMGVATSGVGSVEGTKAADFSQSTASATPTKTFTFSTAVTGWVSQSIALTPAGGALAFTSAPDIPTFSAVTLNGQARTVTSAMPSFSIDDESGSLSGWNVTVSGDSSAGKSAVLKQYCPNASCGTDSGPGYIAGGQTLAAQSLSLDSTGATFSGGARTAPTLNCASGCPLDSASPTKVAAAATNAGAATWSASGFGASSLTLSLPSTLRVLKTNEVYRVDLLWSLNSGP